MTNLLYFAISTRDFIELAEMSIQSGIKEINHNNIHILLIIEKSLKDEVLEKFLKFDIKNLHINCCDKLDESKLSGHWWKYNLKLDIVFFKDLHLYEKIVYCDSDILFTKNSIMTLFDSIKTSDVYITPEDNFPSYKYGYFYHKLLYSDEDCKKIDNSPKKTPMNTGVFGWKNTPDIIKQFEKILNVMDKFYKENNTSNHGSDQVYMNYIFLLDQNIDYSYRNIVTLFPERYIQKNRNIVLENVVFHFISEGKKERMYAVLLLLENSK